MKTIKSKKGFTMVEIVIVLVIIAILIGAAVPAMIGFVGEARGKAYAAEAKNCATAVQAISSEHFVVNNSSPTQAMFLEATGVYNARLGDMLAPDNQATDITAITIDSNGKLTGLIFLKNGYYVKVVPGKAAEVSRTALTLT